MSHQALATQYRPQRFEDFIGQEETVTALRNALKQQQLHHAYLFSGTRGVGKTTLARLLAKCMNCESGITPTPCGTCTACTDITNGRHIDLIEIDAASRTKVEDTRELLDNVPYAPTSGRFKIYLIDEVHMLSKHSFNALLKTLEEPPAHVKFILATTEPEKIPVTVRSRCLHFALKKIPDPQIIERITTILTQEKITFEADALPIIANAAKGSMRDALSLLDKILAYCDSNIQTQAIQTLLGADQAQLSYTLLKQLSQADLPALLQTTQQMFANDHDFTAQLQNLCALLHRLATAQLLSHHSTSEDDALTVLITCFEPTQIQVYYQICLDAQKDLPCAPTPQIGFEMTLLRLLAFVPNSPAPIPSAKAPQKTQVATPSIPQPVAKQAATTQHPSAATDSSKTAPAAQATVDLTQPMDQRWHDTAHALPLTGFSRQLAQHCVCTAWETDADQILKITLQLAPKHAPLLSDAQRLKIEQCLVKFLSKKVALTIALANEACQQQSPAQQQLNEKNKKVQNAINTLEEDAQINQLKSSFNATLLADSVKLAE